MPGSCARAETSFTMSAPASSARSAVSRFRVSTEIIASPAARIASTTGTTRRISSATGTGSDPGRVDSPPTSRISAPALIMSSAAWTASRSVPSRLRAWNESGVQLRMPITYVRRRKSSIRGPQRMRRLASPTPVGSGALGGCSGESGVTGRF